SISLKRFIPVHILYFTAYEEEGFAYFRNDIYLYDRIIEESIKEHSKPTFTMPEKRIISVRINTKPLSN
ncbi:MAG: murein L,D-transpeptidase, partial [Epsilonproteobacteria bacterium]